MKIAIDIDDTIAETTNYLMPLALKFNKEVLNKDNNIDNFFTFPKCFKWTEEELKKFCNEVFEKEVMNIPIIEDSNKYINLLKDSNEIIIASSRNETQLSKPYEFTKNWLEKNNFKFNKLYVGIKYKDEIIKKENIDVFIDNSIGQCTYIKDHNNINVILFDKKKTWKEVYEYINTL